MGRDTLLSCHTEKDLLIFYQSTQRGKNVGERHWKLGFVRSAVHGTTCHTAHKQQLIKKLPVPSTSSRMLEGTLELLVPAESLHEEVKLLFHCVVYHQKNDKFI